MKKIFVLLMLSSMLPLCAMEQEACGEARFAEAEWEVYIKDLQGQLAALKLDERVADPYACILKDARAGILPNAKIVLQVVQRELNNMASDATLPHSVSAPAEIGAGGATVVAANGDGAGSQGGGFTKPKKGILKPPPTEVRKKGKEGRRISFVEIVDVTVFSEDERVEDLLPESSGEDEDSEDGSSDSSVSDGQSSGEEGDASSKNRETVLLSDTGTEKCDVPSLWSRIYKLREKKIDVTYLEDALDAPDAKIDDIEATIAAREAEFGQSSSEEEEEDLSSGEEDGERAEVAASGAWPRDEERDVSSSDEDVLPRWAMKSRDGDEVLASAAQDAEVERRDGDAPVDEDAEQEEGGDDELGVVAPVADETASDTDEEEEAAEERDSEIAALDLALPFSPLAHVDVADERDEEHSGDSDIEASFSTDESESVEENIVDGPPAPAPSPEEPSDDVADEGDAYEKAGGRIGDLDAADEHDAEADCVRIEKQTELAGRLGRLRERSVEVADLWNRLGREETDLAVLEKEIAALEAGPERGASISPLPSPGGKVGTVPVDVGRGWLKRAVQLPVLGKVAGVTFGAFVIGGFTHRHVRTRRAQGKPTIFDRMWSTSKQWKEKAERLVRRS